MSEAIAEPCKLCLDAQPKRDNVMEVVGTTIKGHEVKACRVCDGGVVELARRS